MYNREVYLPLNYSERLVFVKGHLIAALTFDAASNLANFAKAIRPWIIALRLEREAFSLGDEAEQDFRVACSDSELRQILTLWHGMASDEKIKQIGKLVGTFGKANAGEDLLKILADIARERPVGHLCHTSPPTN